MQVNLFIYRQGRDRPRVTTHMTATVSTCNITSEAKNKNNSMGRSRHTTTPHYQNKRCDRSTTMQ